MNTRAKVKQEALTALGLTTGKIGTVAAQVVAAIATVELPHNQWTEVIGILLDFVNNANNAANTSLRVATLQAIGFLCEAIVSTFSSCLSALPCPPDPIGAK